MTELTIRKIRRADEAAFLEMSEAFYASDAVLAPVDSAHHALAFRELMRSDQYVECLFFICAGETAGYALLNKTYSREAGGMVIWIDELYLRPEFRGLGIGGQFLSWLEENTDAARYRLEVEPENVRAAGLYARHGFRKLPYEQMIK